MDVNGVILSLSPSQGHFKQGMNPLFVSIR